MVTAIPALAGKTLRKGERVEVYYNVHKNMFSIRSLDKRNPDKGRVVAHAKYVMLEGATFHTSEAGLQRILANQKKEVFAKVRGYIVHTDRTLTIDHRLGYCNPYTTGGFVDLDSKAPLTNASEVYFYDKYFSYSEAN